MTTEKPFDSLMSFAAIERLVSKIYFRFSPLFLARAEPRDFSLPDRNIQEPADSKNQ
jgi:hypothetical protein